MGAVTDMSNMFKSAAFNQQLCWDVTGKDVTNMFAGTDGASAIVCMPSSQRNQQVNPLEILVLRNISKIYSMVFRLMRRALLNKSSLELSISSRVLDVLFIPLVLRKIFRYVFSFLFILLFCINIIWVCCKVRK